jgi:hypothetical protein
MVEAGACLCFEMTARQLGVQAVRDVLCLQQQRALGWLTSRQDSPCLYREWVVAGLHDPCTSSVAACGKERLQRVPHMLDMACD